ncbi:Hypothetical Protein FCC1311_099422 [Hondaea fermentalgiana]|uniref:Uncharacterized protein n=1 Tax=Hondaea fermentalgiana TaxID=2315210 RepID=A0A2R5GTS0_9STRA|nr:Hypothetical Protein FCC1311_099422 [Hondaea fermentalgiana]|eukprot:GBG33719.1 Hypothetical Protein FCC1311_099422 [Hondaea fermentalgiana]
MDRLRRSLSARKSVKRNEPERHVQPKRATSLRKSLVRRSSVSRQNISQRASVSRENWRRMSTRATGFFQNHVKSGRRPEEEEGGASSAADDEAESRLPLEQRGFRRRTLTRSRKMTTNERRYSEHAELAAYGAGAADIDMQSVASSTSGPPSRKVSSHSTSSSSGASTEASRRSVNTRSLYVSDEARLSMHSRNLSVRTAKAERKLDGESTSSTVNDQDGRRAYLSKRNGRKSVFL